jgi:hypothetical protein
MAQTLQYKTTAQRARIQTSSAGIHHPVAGKANHELTFKPDQLGGADQYIRANWLSNRVFEDYDDLVDPAARRGTSSSTSPGGSCPSDCAIGRTGSDQWDLVLLSRACLYIEKLVICFWVARFFKKKYSEA